MAWLRQVVIFRASPDVLFDTYLSSRKYTAATRAQAVMSQRVRGKFTAHGGHLRGKNVAIVPKRLIGQAWRAANWKKTTSGEKWTVGVVAHHVAASHAGIAGLVDMVAKGKPCRT